MSPQVSVLDSLLNKKRTKISQEQKSLKYYLFIAFAVIIANLFFYELLARSLIVLVKPPQSHSVDFDSKYQLTQDRSALIGSQFVVLGDSMASPAIYTDLLNADLTKKVLKPVG